MSEEWTDRVLIQDLKLEMSIGIYEKERLKSQPVLVSVVLDVSSNEGRPLRHVDEVVSYEAVVNKIRDIAHNKHYELIEEFAEEVAKDCLKDKRISRVKITAIKTEILPETSGVGVTISRKQLP